MSLSTDIPLKPPANPGAAATAILLDTTLSPDGLTTLSKRKSMMQLRRAIVGAFIDQNATLFVDWLAPGSVTWRPYDAAGYAITANTFFQKDCLCLGDDTRIRIVTVTGPTLWEVSIRGCPDRGLGE